MSRLRVDGERDGTVSARAIIALAVVSGLLLAIAGASVPTWMAPPGGADAGAAARLAESPIANLVYVLAVFASCALFAPVLIVLTMRLHRLRPTGALVGAAVFGFGLLLESAATTGSLARLTMAADAAAGDVVALALFQTLTVQYLAVDFAGVGLIYVAAVVYAVTLWRVHRATSWALIVSTALLFLGFAVSPLALPFLAASIVVYGVAYVLLGVVAVRLEVARP